MQLKQEIKNYWTNRADGYSEYNQQEMADERYLLWKHKLLELLREAFPNRTPSDVKILDIGCGPGFFSIMLAEEGYMVTALDYTEEMIAEAKKNAGEQLERIDWCVGDAQALPFQEKQFDVVLSRNVTWNLPDPYSAYKEWYRVLRSGGRMWNFDADWYGYLFDEEKKKAFEADRRQVRDRNMDDYYEGTGTDNEKMEAIARKVPLSQKKRPAWDLEALEKAGFENIRADEEVWKDVWNEEEITNNASTPLFLLYGRREDKQKNGPQAEPFILGSAVVAPGERWSGEILMSDGKTRLPGTILRGKQEGKTVLITAGIHAAEYVGIQAAIELAERLKIEKVAGTIIIIKTTNRPAFEHRSGSLGYSDHKNLNRIFPGDPEGSEMERLAALIVRDLFCRIDYYIDLHGGDDYEQLTPYVYYAGVAAPEVMECSREMAQQVDVPYMVKSNVATGGAYNYAASLGIPSILIERGGEGLWNREESGSTRRDVRNVLCHLGVYQGQKDYRKYFPIDVVDLVYQAAAEKGLWYPQKKAGSMIRQGELLGEMRDYEGNLLESSIASFDGVILYQTVALPLQAEDSMIAYGRIQYESDRRKERIVRYWGKRSESFLDQRRKELHAPIADRWRDEIFKMLPSRPLRILDVGCGTGFFTILLAMEGHHVTGVDLTPEMIENSRRLAEEERVSCEFLVMDAENLNFPEETFDVIISRNLTWTLPHAEMAYKSWIRVLKKGGILLNYDANYGLSDFTDNKGLPKTHAHHTVGKEMTMEAEELKRQLPISSYSRPAWDLETLERIGIKQFEMDLGISSRIYLEKDEFYNPTPMFALRCVKSKS